MEIEELYILYKKSYKVTTDTRSQLDNSIFFALKGDNFNGNLYAKEALKKGANFAVIDEEQDELEDRLILVEDVLQTLQNLATYHRQCLDIPIIALTGSNGKTTTKELINAVLIQKFNCKSTKGNLNNHIGVPLTLLSMEPETEIGVVEMGANHKKEIAELCKIAQPDFGYITNFGKVHLEGFGSLKGVIEAKTEMYSYLKKENKMAFINAEDKVQVERSKGMNVINFCSKNSDYPVEFIGADPYVKVGFENMVLQSKLIGKYNYLNIATAIATGKYFGVSNNQIKEAIEEYVPSNNRSQIITKGSNEII
ncbi:MAG: UDP-N-acetylmuramoyl-tripeptide--D-alanyl-D-alanine ligase, partial [Bacteroidetes bacterium]|nr:UDP-N-acetylmuramoyl-tripeptide--D-alanyl-D-alanine ligase [Bacteroidota bacterium]